MARAPEGARIKQIIESISNFIKQGQGTQARVELRKLDGKALPREHALEVARLGRRAYLPLIGLKLLNPLVRPTRKNPIPATAAEKAEYAACLIKVGASEEALGILNSLESEGSPEVDLFRSFALFTRWDHGLAIPYLQRYVAAPSLDDYQRLVGRVNLTSSLIAERRHHEATHLIEEVLEECRKRNHTLLLGNTLHLAAINAVFQHKWDEGEKYLAEGKRSFTEHKTLEEFLLRMWEVILVVMKSRGSEQSLHALRKVQEEARRRSHWESIRDCDRFRSIATDDEKLLHRIYFGSPYPSFRKWLLLGFGRNVELPTDYVWRLGEGRKSGPVLDLSGALVGKSGKALGPGEVVHRLLATLASDFYRPFRLAALHHHLYPGEFYNPLTSPGRVHQAMRRFRAWCREGEFPLEVLEKAGVYRLTASSSFAIRLRLEAPISDRREKALRDLEREFAGKTFSAEEARRFLDTSYRSAIRVLELGLEQGTLERVGRGAKTRYVVLVKGNLKAVSVA